MAPVCVHDHTLVFCFNNHGTAIVCLHRIGENDLMKFSLLIDHGYTLIAARPYPVLTITKNSRDIIGAELGFIRLVISGNNITIVPVKPVGSADPQKTIFICCGTPCFIIA
jgi:hypothetical protein